MKKLQGSETEKNLLIAFAGESQARNRYSMYANKAKKEGFIQISAIFSETADQEKEHAKRLFNFLDGDELQITASFPVGVIGSTMENLNSATIGENYEWTDMYPSFAKIARNEGYDKIAAVFENIAIAEKQHDKRYSALYKNIEDGKVFKRGENTVWYCRNCGFIHEGSEPPKVCPACIHAQAHFEVLGENW